ncbi:MAG: hypothetical protein KC502_13410 [Myxococcales bacterium]|nr:hypothetical protein [Myxococcales bacterium]
MSTLTRLSPFTLAFLLACASPSGAGGVAPAPVDAGDDTGTTDSASAETGGGQGDASTPDASPADASTADGGAADSLVASGDGGGAVDAGATDAGTTQGDASSPDVANPDSAVADTAKPDAGVPDTGSPDAGTPDAGTPDTGSPDAGTPDAGKPDAGTPDAGGTGPCGAKPSCDDGNPCTKDSCSSDQCLHFVQAGACDDGDPCTVSDACQSGACKGGGPKKCDDNNPCTTDSCDGKTGKCLTKPKDGSCDDGNPCTLGDSCDKGSCKGGAPKKCDDNNPCTTDSCDGKTGKCVTAAKSGACSDGNACTTSDVCKGGTCTGTGAKVCNDNNPCTTDSCDAKSGGCVTAPKTGSCDDGNVCTTGDACTSGKCAGKPKNCGDGNDCTQDLCDAKTGTCSAKKLSGTACDNNDPCSITDKCIYGTCFADKKKTCDDGNVCTNDYCLSTQGGKCSHFDHCGGVKAVSVPYVQSFAGSNCYAPYNWKLDSKYAAEGYWGVDQTPSSPPAPSGKCTLNYGTSSGTYKCSAYAATNRAVTLPFFDLTKLAAGANLELRFVMVGTWSASDVFRLEARDDTSSKWVQVSKLNAPGPTWTALAIDLSSWVTKKQKLQLRFVFSVAKCAGSSVVGGTGPRIDELSVGIKGSCISAVQCSDGNSCTHDYCSTTKKTCYHTSAVASCSDGNGCTAGDACKSGKCTAQAPKSCDDKDACTADSCDPKTGLCSHQAQLSCLKTLKLPVVEPFACGTVAQKGWKMTGTPNGPSWAVDASPSYYKEAGYRSKSCSANFNDGKWYVCPSGSSVKKVGGSLTSPLLDATAAKAGEEVYAEFWLMGDFDYDDTIALETSTDGKSWSTLRKFGGYGTHIKKASWQLYVEKLPEMAGKKFLMRLRFESGNCVNNNQKGLFIDDLKIHAVKPCGQYDPYDHGYGYYHIGTVHSSKPSNYLEPPMTLKSNEQDTVQWFQQKNYNGASKVQVKWESIGKVSVCASFKCYKSKAYKCTVQCPSGTKEGYWSGYRVGCCTTSPVTGKRAMSFTLGGSSIKSGYGYLSIKNMGASCQQVKASVHW